MAEFLHIKTEDGEVYMVNRGVAEDLTFVIGEAQRREIMKFFEWKCLNRDF